jgi:hypothetical protein
MKIGVILPISASDGVGGLPTWPTCRPRWRPSSAIRRPLRRTVGMNCELTDPGELARRLDACEKLGIDDLVVGFEPVTAENLDLIARAVALRA